MQSKLLVLLILTLIGGFGLMAHMFRYEHHGPMLRSDRLTGVVETYCPRTSTWAPDFMQCP